MPRPSAPAGRRFLLCVAVALFPCGTGQAQEGAPAQGPRVLARFESATSLDTDVRGFLYVLDGARSTLTKLDQGGRVVAVWGGPGAGDTQFDEPKDIEATNGLELYVADAGNRRVKRFSGEFVPLESIVLNAPSGVAGVGDDGRSDRDLFVLDTGRPVSVARASDGTLFAADDERNVVVKWGAGRRIERVFGGLESGEGALVQPTSLAIGADGRVFVGDVGRREIVVFDQFGSFLRTMASGGGFEPRALDRSGDDLIATAVREIRVYSVEGLLEVVVKPDVGEPLVDAALVEGAWYLLTPTRLLHFDR